ncbi:MAG: hypothetical protein Tsb0034_13200 [Ekhidna sp.]
MKSLIYFVLYTMAVSLFSQSGERWYYCIDENNLALRGYDVTTYFTESESDANEIPEKGDPEISHVHEGITYHFASKSNRNQFVKNPDKYLPKYGGWCAYRMAQIPSEEGWGQSRVPSFPLEYEIIDGELYLFSKTGQGSLKSKWEAHDQSTMIERADRFWESRHKLARMVDGKPEGLNVNARMETILWDRFIGVWKGEGHQLIDTVKKVYTDFQPATWTFYYGYDGFCIQDDWKTEVNIGGTFNGPAIRGYDPVNEEWHMTFIPINASRGSTWMMTGKFNEKNEMEGYFEGTDFQGRPFQQKIYFYNISDDRFSWKADRSYDGGKTWIKKFTYTECERLE